MNAIFVTLIELQIIDYAKVIIIIHIILITAIGFVAFNGEED